MRPLKVLSVLSMVAAVGAPAVAQTRKAAAPVANAAQNAAIDPARTVEIIGTDDMKYSVTRITARRGEQLRIRLISKGTIPKVAMAHNVVVLQMGTDVEKFVNAGAPHRAADFIAPAMKDQVIAKTRMAGPGETVDVVFTVPRKAGTYPFVCTFAGHYQAGMKGVLAVR